MKFIKLQNGHLLNARYIQVIRPPHEVYSGEFRISYDDHHENEFFENFSTEKEAQSRFEEIQKLLGIE